MKDKKVGMATQDGSGGYTGKDGYPSIKTGKMSGQQHTDSVASPSSLKVGTKEGKGGIQRPSPGDIACPGQREGGGYIVPLKKG